MARGNVPKPVYMEHYQARINAVAGQNCTEMARDIQGSAWHTEAGGFIGTMQWFDNPANGALTDFQIGGPWDGQYDGVIMRFIEEDQGVVPWANGVMGKVRPPFDEAALFIARWVAPTGNAENLNARARSMELSDGGQPNRDRELTGPQIESLAFNTAYVHSEEIGQSWNEFTDNFLHYQTGTDHVDCPGAWLKANKAAVRARTVAVMKAYQTNTKLARPLLITYPPGWTGATIPQPGAGGSSGGAIVSYPTGYDAGSCAKIWTALGSAKTYPQYKFDEGGSVSKLWLNELILSPLVYHQKDTTDGRELFVFASGDAIGRDNNDQPFRVMNAA